MGYITYYSGQTVDTWLDLLHEYGSNPSAYANGYAEIGGMRYQLAQTDIMKDFLSETGFQQKHDFSVSGGPSVLHTVFLWDIRVPMVL